MNRILRLSSPLFLLFLVVISACGPDGRHVRLKGRLKGITQADLLIYSADAPEADSIGFDTVKVEKGEFSYERLLSTPTLLTVVYPNSSTTTFVGEPGETIHLTADANRLREVEVSGTEANDRLTEFRLRALRLPASDVEREAASFVRSHPKSPASVAVFRQYFDEVQTHREQPTLDLLDLLVQHQPSSPDVRATDTRLRPQLRTALGARLPDFSATTTSGRTLTAAALRGRPAFIVFTAGWSGLSFQLRETLRQVRRAHGSRVEIITLCLDPDVATARSIALRDSLPNALCPGGALSTPLAHTFGVRYVPGCLLIDRAGRIISRDLSFDRWVDEVGRL